MFQHTLNRTKKEKEELEEVQKNNFVTFCSTTVCCHNILLQQSRKEKMTFTKFFINALEIIPYNNNQYFIFKLLKFSLKS